MAALSPGAPAPRFTTPLLGGEIFRFDAAVSCLLAFFHISCPTCQYTFPFLERLYRNKLQSSAIAAAKIQIYGVSQDDEAATRAFADRFGLTFPILLDDLKTYPLSNAYGITTVPTLFLISAGGLIEFTTAGWSRADIETLNARLANLADGTPVPLFHAGEQVLSWKPG